MNTQECDILCALIENPCSTQRSLSKYTGHSLGIVNRCIKSLISSGHLDSDMNLTPKALSEFEKSSPKNAIILAAGFGMRMVPINTETPKGLLEVHGETLIERLIRQLREVNINDIYIIVGFMKEQYEYLIDTYGVKLIVNAEYASKNNLHSLKLALSHLSNSYIVPCDIWCKENPFNCHELYSWYMVSDIWDPDSSVRANRKKELICTSESEGGNSMIGISYICKTEAEEVKKRICELSSDSRYNGAFWEEALYKKGRMIASARLAKSSNIAEINTYEQLRELDSGSNHLKSDAIEIASNVLGVSEEEICNITTLKKGMTNRSFLFSCKGRKYIMRIPGEGTEYLINRYNEFDVYRALKGKHICDDIQYINPDNGYKITQFLENAHVCNPQNRSEVKKCMRKLRQFHAMHLKVSHRFDLYEQIDFYESLWGNVPSMYKDYEDTKRNVLSLRSYIESHITQEVLTHIDAVPDNFLFTTDSNGNESIRIIDWEYAGMQDPHVDIAMFCIYSFYDKDDIDKTIADYFPENCPELTKIKIYCYVATCGLLWSNWCEYKRNLGIDFGEYSLKQYRYAKDYYRIVKDELKGSELKCPE